MGDRDGLVPSLGTLIATGLQQGLEDLHNSVRGTLATTSTLFLAGDEQDGLRQAQAAQAACPSCGRPGDAAQPPGRSGRDAGCAKCAGDGARGDAGAATRGARGAREAQPVTALVTARSARRGPWQGGGAGVRGADLEAILWPLASQAKALCYKQVGPMSECARACLAAQGFRRLEGNGSEWTLAWGSTLPDARLAQMRADQFHNHIPGWDQLNNKGTLAEMAERSRARGQRLAHHVPKSWVLPRDAPDLLRDSAAGGGPYIVKPIGGTRGRGIQLFAELTEEDIKGVSRVVVQRYIKEPHLINRRKYDLRLYVAATRQNFSLVLSVVVLSGESARALTFEKFLPARALCASTSTSRAMLASALRYVYI